MAVNPLANGLPQKDDRRSKNAAISQDSDTGAALISEAHDKASPGPAKVEPGVTSTAPGSVAPRAFLSFTPITDDEIDRLWQSIERPLDEIRDDEVWYEVTSLRESIRRLLTEREQR